MIAPKKESVDLVQEWLDKELTGSGADVTVKGDYATVQASVKTIEKLLKTEYSTFGKTTIAPLQIYSLCTLTMNSS